MRYHSRTINQMRKTMLVAVYFIVGLVALVLVVGLMLPEKREFVRTATFRSQPEKVFQIVTDVKNQTSWRRDVQDIVVIDEATWTEIPRRGTAITFRTRRKVENQSFEIEIIGPENFNGYWVGTFERIPTGTKVVFKEVIAIANPFLRVVSSLFVDLDKTMDVYMMNLKTKLGE